MGGWCKGMFITADKSYTRFALNCVSIRSGWYQLISDFHNPRVTPLVLSHIKLGLALHFHKCTDERMGEWISGIAIKGDQPFESDLNKNEEMGVYFTEHNGDIAVHNYKKSIF